MAIVVGWSSIGSVSHTVRSGYATAITANQTSSAAYNMHVSQVQNDLDDGKITKMHAGDMAAFNTLMATYEKQLTTPAEKAQARVVDAAFNRWQSLDKQVQSLTEAGNRGLERLRSVERADAHADAGRDRARHRRDTRVRPVALDLAPRAADAEGG